MRDDFGVKTVCIPKPIARLWINRHFVICMLIRRQHKATQLSIPRACSMTSLNPSSSQRAWPSICRSSVRSLARCCGNNGLTRSPAPCAPTHSPTVGTHVFLLPIPSPTQTTRSSHCLPLLVKPGTLPDRFCLGHRQGLATFSKKPVLPGLLPRAGAISLPTPALLPRRPPTGPSGIKWRTSRQPSGKEPTVPGGPWKAPSGQ